MQIYAALRNTPNKENLIDRYNKFKYETHATHVRGLPTIDRI